MKVKRKVKESYSEWFARHEQVELSHRGRERQKRKVLGEKAQYEQRFKDAVHEYHDQKYRRSTEKLVSRMFNNLLVRIHGTFMQRARQSIVINTSVSQVIIKTNSRGLNKKGKFGWKMIGTGTLSMEEYETERREVLIEMNRLTGRVKRSKAITNAQQQTQHITAYITDKPYVLEKIKGKFWEGKMDLIPLPKTNQNLKKGLGE